MRWTDLTRPVLTSLVSIGIRPANDGTLDLLERRAYWPRPLAVGSDSADGLADVVPALGQTNGDAGW